MIEPEITCPQCGCRWVGATIEEGVETLSCSECFWGRIERHPFNLGSWYVTIRRALAPLDILQSLLADSDITDILRPRLKGVSHLSHPIPNFETSDEYLRGEIEIANSVFLAQMIILAITYSELILKDYFEALFIAKPKQMNPYLSSDGKGKATIDLNEFLEADSKDTLIELLAKRASEKASAQNPEKLVERMIKECDLKIDSSFPQDIKKLKELRNGIVHEGNMDGITPELVISSFGQIMCFLYVIGEAAIRQGVVTVDEPWFISKTRKRLELT